MPTPETTGDAFGDPRDHRNVHDRARQWWRDEGRSAVRELAPAVLGSIRILAVAFFAVLGAYQVAQGATVGRMVLVIAVALFVTVVVWAVQTARRPSSGIAAAVVAACWWCLAPPVTVLAWRAYSDIPSPGTDPITAGVPENVQNVAVGIGIWGALALLGLLSLRGLTRPGAARAVRAAMPASDLATTRKTDEQAWTLPLERRARHEAAHVTAYLTLGVPVLEVDLKVRGDGSEGRVLTQEDLSWPVVERAYANLVGAVAANVQDLRDNIHDGGSANDLHTAQAHVWRIISCGTRPAHYHGPLTADALYEAARSHAGRILDTKHDLIEKIAARLVEHSKDGNRKPLSGKDFDAYLGAADKQLTRTTP